VKLAITPEQLGGFLALLRTHGWRIGVDQHVSAQRVLQHMRGTADLTLGDVRDSIGALICSSPQDQQAYQTLFDDFFVSRWRWAQERQRDDVGKAVATSGSRQNLRRGRAMLWIAAVAGIAAILLLGSILLFSSRPALPGPPTAPIGQPAAPVVTPAASRPLAAFWSLPLALGGIGCFFIFGLLVLRFRRQAALRREFGNTQEFEEHLLQVGSRPAWPELRLLASRLHLRTPSEVMELDIEKTVETSAANGGWPTPVHRVLRFLPSYVVLIDRQSARDHLAGIYESVVQGLQQAALPISVYEFRGNPRTLRTIGVAGHLIGVRDVERMHHRARLVVLSDTGGMVNPLSGELQAWPFSPAAWSNCYLVVPPAVAAQRGRLEKFRQRGFEVVSADRAGLLTLAQIVAEERIQPAPPVTRKPLTRSTLRLLDRRPVSVHEEEAFCKSLREILGGEAYLWLSACAVYPSLQPQLTTYLGRELGFADAEGVLLAQLVELPWFRRGFMPDWLRVALLTRMPPNDETRVRSALATLFNQALQNTPGGFMLPIVTRPNFWVRIKRSLLLSDLRASQDTGGPARDWVLLDFLNGRKLQRLHVAVPTGLRRFLRRVGPRLRPPLPSAVDVPLTGWKRVAALFVGYVPIVSFIVWATTRNRDVRWNAAQGSALLPLYLTLFAATPLLAPNYPGGGALLLGFSAALLVSLIAFVSALIARKFRIPLFASIADRLSLRVPPTGHSAEEILTMYLCYLPVLALIPRIGRREDREIRFHASRGLLLMALWLASLFPPVLIASTVLASLVRQIATMFFVAAAIVIPSFVLMDFRMPIPLLDFAARGAAAIGVVSQTSRRPLIKSRRAGELVGIFVLALGIMLGLAIATYSPTDASAFYSSGNAKIENWIGYYGATVAWLFVGFFGLASLLYPGTLLVLGWKRFWGTPIDLFRNGLIVIALSVTLPMLLDASLGKIWLRGAIVPSGGYFGAESNKLAATKFHLGPTGVMALALLLNAFWYIPIVKRQISRLLRAAVRSSEIAAPPATSTNSLLSLLLVLQAFVFVQVGSNILCIQPALSNALIPMWCLVALLSGLLADRMTGPMLLVRLAPAVICAGSLLTFVKLIPSNFGRGVTVVGLALAAPPLLMLALRAAGAATRFGTYLLIALCCNPVLSLVTDRLGTSPLLVLIMACLSPFMVRNIADSAPAAKVPTIRELTSLLGLLSLFALGQQMISWVLPPRITPSTLPVITAVSVAFLFILSRISDARSYRTMITFAFAFLGAAATAAALDALGMGMARIEGLDLPSRDLSSGASMLIVFVGRLLLDTSLVSFISTRAPRVVLARIAAMYLSVGTLATAVPTSWGSHIPPLFIAVLAIATGVSGSGVAALRERARH